MSQVSSKRYQVDGKPIFVVDGALEQQNILALDRAFRASHFERTEIARPDTANVRHWALNFPMEDCPRLPIYNPTLQIVANVLPHAPYRPYRAYCNLSVYGDMLYTHTDCLPDADEFTVLWYLNSNWDIEWGGETLFFDDKDDAQVVVSPRPGRLVIFHGAIKHAGRPPSRSCFEPRFTFAFKLERV